MYSNLLYTYEINKGLQGDINSEYRYIERMNEGTNKLYTYICTYVRSYSNVLYTALMK